VRARQRGRWQPEWVVGVDAEIAYTAVDDIGDGGLCAQCRVVWRQAHHGGFGEGGSASQMLPCSRFQRRRVVTPTETRRFDAGAVAGAFRPHRSRGRSQPADSNAPDTRRSKCSFHAPPVARRQCGQNRDPCTRPHGAVGLNRPVSLSIPTAISAYRLSVIAPNVLGKKVHVVALIAVSSVSVFSHRHTQPHCGGLHGAQLNALIQTYPSRMCCADDRRLTRPLTRFEMASVRRGSGCVKNTLDNALEQHKRCR
jgi:hypothetical protein